MITLFTAPKAFEGHIGRIQRNAIRSWLALGDEVEIIMIGSESGMDRAAAELGVIHLPTVERNQEGTPLISSIFSLAHEYGKGDVLCYLNADILLTSEFISAVDLVAEEFERFLVVGQRWDVQVEKEIPLSEFIESDPLVAMLANAHLHPPSGSDYFVFGRDQFEMLPPFALGRAGWDNWMIYSARAEGVPVIDATDDVRILHQEHDYQHLPGGQAHYRLPESSRNVELAGGREMMFTLKDADWRLSDGELSPIGPEGPGRWRRWEAAAIVRFGPGTAARLTRMFFHFPETLNYYISRFRNHDDDVESNDAREEKSKPWVDENKSMSQE
jgi:hypothetical protein